MSRGTPLHNDFDEDFGAIGLDTALTNSVNTYFAQLGEKVGEDTLFKYMNALRLQRQAADRPALRPALGQRHLRRTAGC